MSLVGRGKGKGEGEGRKRGVWYSQERKGEGEERVEGRGEEKGRESGVWCSQKGPCRKVMKSVWRG